MSLDSFEDWKSRALQVDLLEVARSHGAQLRRAGGEWVGPCPACGGTDRFGVNTKKGVWVCRGAGGGDAIALEMHLGGVDFLTACETLTGEPPPRGRGRGISQDEMDKREERRRLSDEKAEKQRLEAEMDEAQRLAAASQIWAETAPIGGTLAERYLVGRGIPIPPSGWPSVLGFHRSLRYPGGSSFPCLVARVDDAFGELTAVWRIFLDPATAGKAKVDNPKLGLGPASGGAVRIGGLADRIGCAEGLETSLAAWTLERYRFPVWATLSTSGMTGLELPLDVKRLVIFPDGDMPREMPDGSISVPPGLKAARVAAEKQSEFLEQVSIIDPPGPGRDFLNVLARRSMMAA